MLSATYIFIRFSDKKLVFFTFIYVFRTVQVVIVIDIMKKGIQHDSVNQEDDTSFAR